MLEKIKVRTGMMLVLACFVMTLAVACGLSWMNAESSAREIEDLNNVAVHQVDPLYETSTALLRARLALGGGSGDLQAGANDQAAAPAAAGAGQLRQARERFARYMAVPKSERGQELAQSLQGRFNAYVAALDELEAALRERSVARYQQGQAQARQADAAFAKDMQAFLARVQERSDGVLERSQNTYATARLSAIVLLSAAVLLAALCWVFIRRGVLLPLQDAGRHFDRIAAGDLTQRVDARANNEIGLLFSAVRRMQDGLTRTVTTVRQGVEEINVGAAEIAAGNANLSTRTEEQAAALEQTASTMEELAATVKQNAENAAQANQLAAVSMEVAQRGGRAVGQVVATMQGISDSSQRIADIVSVIDGIAFQTNILALNAAVEAARAGGIDQVSLAVSQMDEVTQQNAALVEQASAAASAMADQARRLAEATAAFKTQSGQVIEAAPVRMAGNPPASRLSRS
ncbi:MAG: methyl-accepting chemotaxis protein [Achromobacter sp.]|uniref:methyl-accepting chemotaxis protein n=1 Tax=Achromobacter sp. TaxID=134375 RepID=UPI003D02383D